MNVKINNRRVANHQYSLVVFLLPKTRTNERRAEMERLTHEADFGLEEWEQTLYFVNSDQDGAYNILDIANQEGEEEFDEILKTISLGLKHYEDTGLTPPEIMGLKERNTAKAPIDADEDYGFFTCPSCGEAIYASDDFKSHKFCLNCGQRIRWEEW